MNELQPYPTMKDSGVEWLGEVPEHWEVRRLRNMAALRVSNVDKHVKEGEALVRLCNYVDVYKHDHISQQMDFMRATATPEEINRFRLREGDVLITKDSEAWDDIGVPALVTESADDLISGYHLALLRPFAEELSGGFLLRALQSNGLAYQFHVEAKGVTRYGLAHVAIKSVWLSLPTPSEQAAIVRYLDYVDRRVRRLVRAKRKLIALLTEQKQAIIHRAVTRGLDPEVPLKDSGVEWLGEVPEHWDIIPLCSIAKTKSISNQQDRELLSIYLDLGVIRFSDVKEKRTNVTSQDLSKYQAVDAGDFVLNNQQAWRGSVGVSKYTGIVSPAYLVLALHSQINPEFANLRFRDRSMIDQYLVASRGVGSIQRNLYWPHLKRAPTSLPPLPEQADIIAFLGDATADNDLAVARAAREIDLLNEYRTRLVADVVTGKLDVSRAAAGLPEVDCLATEDNQLEGTFDTVAEEKAGNPGESVER